MSKAKGVWGQDQVNCWEENSTFLGQALTRSSSEPTRRKQPYNDTDQKFIFTSVARVDNRVELAKSLKISNQDAQTIDDSELVRKAYCCWGEKTSARIYGDWSFAAWHPAEKKLHVARDHHGNTSLYYYVDRNIFAFSSSRKVLLDLKLSPNRLDELYLAQVLTSWDAYDGVRTFHDSIFRLPPAHTITVSTDKFHTNQYWHLTDTSMLRLERRSDYIEAFREVFDEAVYARLWSPGNEKIAVTLSGGLDSSSVAVVAAEFLKSEGRRLNGYTSIPLSDTSRSEGKCIGNEFHLAQTTARLTGSIDHLAIDAAAISPIQAIRKMLKIVHEPCHTAGNLFWILALIQQAAADGCKVLLTGQVGNATISWAGGITSQPFLFQLQRLGWQRLLKEKIKQLTPYQILKLYSSRQNKILEWYRSSAILPEFARRIKLFELIQQDADTLKDRSPQELRHDFINPGRFMGGALHAEMGAAAGLEIRDPTADVRIIEFTYSVPDHIFMDPKTGFGRCLIREAMKGRLPEEVRLNRRHGRQAADRVQRLRACSSEVESALEELAAGPASMYVDVAYMRKVWHKVLAEDTSETFAQSGSILTRGIMAGLFVNGLEA